MTSESKTTWGCSSKMPTAENKCEACGASSEPSLKSHNQHALHPSDPPQARPDSAAVGLDPGELYGLNAPWSDTCPAAVTIVHQYSCNMTAADATLAQHQSLPGAVRCISMSSMLCQLRKLRHARCRKVHLETARGFRAEAAHRRGIGVGCCALLAIALLPLPVAVARCCL